MGLDKGAFLFDKGSTEVLAFYGKELAWKQVITNLPYQGVKEDAYIKNHLGGYVKTKLSHLNFDHLESFWQYSKEG